MNIYDILLGLFGFKSLFFFTNLWFEAQPLPYVKIYTNMYYIEYTAQSSYCVSHRDGTIYTNDSGNLELMVLGETLDPNVSGVFEYVGFTEPNIHQWYGYVSNGAVAIQISVGEYVIICGTISCWNEEKQKYVINYPIWKKNWRLDSPEGLYFPYESATGNVYVVVKSPGTWPFGVYTNYSTFSPPAYPSNWGLVTETKINKIPPIPQPNMPAYCNVDTNWVIKFDKNYFYCLDESENPVKGWWAKINDGAVTGIYNITYSYGTNVAAGYLEVSKSSKKFKINTEIVNIPLP